MIDWLTDRQTDWITTELVDGLDDCTDWLPYRMTH